VRGITRNLITSIRDSFMGSQSVFNYGSCYQLYKILKTVFPEAKPLINLDGQHIVTNIGGINYDINGINKEDFFIEMTKEQLAYYEGRRFDINNPSFFVLEWFVDEEFQSSHAEEYMKRLAESIEGCVVYFN